MPLSGDERDAILVQPLTQGVQLQSGTRVWTCCRIGIEVATGRTRNPRRLEVVAESNGRELGVHGVRFCIDVHGVLSNRRVVQGVVTSNCHLEVRVAFTPTIAELGN